MAYKGALISALRVALLVVIAYAIAGYIMAARRSPWPWRVNPLNPFAGEAPVTVQIELRGKELILRVFRSYSEPFARRVRLNVTVCDKECLLYTFVERLPIGATREFTVYLPGIRVCEIRVSVILEGRLVGVRQSTFDC